MDGIPIGPLFFGAGLVVAIPFAILAVLWGGRGVVRGVAGLFMVLIGWLIWIVLIQGSAGGTGMEGLGVVVAVGIWVATSVWGGLVYIFVGALQSLPWQRRARAAKRHSNG